MFYHDFFLIIQGEKVRKIMTVEEEIIPGKSALNETVLLNKY